MKKPSKQTDKLCENCGHKISKERLKALPNTEYCVKCSDKCAPEKIYNADDICAQPSIIEDGSDGD